MNSQELETAVRMKLHIVVVVHQWTREPRRVDVDIGITRAVIGAVLEVLRCLAVVYLAVVLHASLAAFSRMSGARHEESFDFTRDIRPWVLKLGPGDPLDPHSIGTEACNDDLV